MKKNIVIVILLIAVIVLACLSYNLYLQTPVKLAEKQGIDLRMKTLEAQIKSRLTTMRPTAEIYYDKAYSYAGLCSQLDKKGLESFTCHDSEKAYAISAQLPSSKYFCVDSTGKAQNTDSGVFGTSCN